VLRRGFDQGDIMDAPPRQLRRDGNARRAAADNRDTMPKSLSRLGLRCSYCCVGLHMHYLHED